MNHKLLTQARAQMVKFGHAVAEVLAAQCPETPIPSRMRRRHHSQVQVNWRQGDHLVELVAGFYTMEPAILRISGNCRFFRASYNLLRQLGFFPRCAVCYRRCPKVWNGTEIVCARSGLRRRDRDWKPDQAPTHFELSCLPGEIVSLAPLAVAIASGVPMADLVQIPGARLLTLYDQAAPNMSYCWTIAGHALIEEDRLRREEQRARREALRNERNKAS